MEVLDVIAGKGVHTYSMYKILQRETEKIMKTPKGVQFSVTN